ncbi:MAG: hypothetical protein QG635_1162, partial [Bacteroidota bacterium]|nr:hypothetical protein [Bacteroidota bacterium]
MECFNKLIDRFGFKGYKGIDSFDFSE